MKGKLGDKVRLQHILEASMKSKNIFRELLLSNS